MDSDRLAILLTQNTSEVNLRFGDSTYASASKSDDEFSFSKRVKNDLPYTVFISGSQLPKADSIAYSITVILIDILQFLFSQISDSYEQEVFLFRR
jgi:hypothetical protein